MSPSTFDPFTLAQLRAVRADLSDALSLLDAKRLGTAAFTPTNASAIDEPLDPDGRRRAEYLPSDYPRIGGRDVRPEHTAAFTMPEWRDEYRAGDACELLIGYCLGQAELRRSLRRHCYYAAIDHAGQAYPHVRRLQRERCGAGSYVNGVYVEDVRGWSDWSLAVMHHDVRPSAGSPITVTARGIVVRPPDTYPLASFMTQIRSEIDKGSVAAWLATPEGRQHCGALRVDPAIGQRFTSPPAGTAAAPTPVHAIGIFGQREVQARLIHLAERAMVAHVAERRKLAA